MEQRIAGKELDVEIAARVMGHTWDESRCRICGWPAYDTTAEGCVADNCSMRPLPKRRADEPAHYSTDIAAAMLVIVEVLRKHPDWTFSLDGGDASHIHIGGIPSPSDYTGIGWRAEFSIPPDASTRFGHPRYREFAPTAPLAVCLAALAAVTARESSDDNRVPTHGVPIIWPGAYE